MALIKCPECNKEMSDTLNKCPHCGYKNKKVSNDKINGVIKKIKNNKKFMIIGGILIFLVIALGVCLYIAGEEKRLVMEAVEHLEDEDYDCDLEKGYTDYSDAYVCTLTEKGMKHEFVLTWSDDLFSNLLEDNFSAEYHFEDGEFKYRLVKANFYDQMNFVRVSGYCMYVPNGYKEDFDAVFGRRNEAVVDSCPSYDNSEGCVECRSYLDTFNESLDTYRDLYEELDLEI